MKTKIGFQDPLTLNAGQKYCRMLKGEHSVKLSTFIKLPLVIMIFVLSTYEWSFYTGFTVSLCVRGIFSECQFGSRSVLQDPPLLFTQSGVPDDGTHPK